MFFSLWLVVGIRFDLASRPLQSKGETLIGCTKMTIRMVIPPITPIIKDNDICYNITVRLSWYHGKIHNSMNPYPPDSLGLFQVDAGVK